MVSATRAIPSPCADQTDNSPCSPSATNAPTKWSDFTESHRTQLILIAHYFNHKALALEPGRTPGAAQPLSPREIDAISLLAMGYSRAQVAQTLSISEHTLRAYVESARLKLGAINTLHAVARALSRGLIIIT
jgi:DNA-binding CsgD family transcriptional regulator